VKLISYLDLLTVFFWDF